MLPALVRHVLYPLHEALVGRPTMRHLRELEETQWLAPRELQAFQQTKLRALLRHADANTPFHRGRIRAASIALDFENIGDEWRRLPLLDKSEIRASLADMLWTAAPGGLVESHTGGSSGEPLRFFIDRRRQACDQAARFRAYRWFGVELGQRELYLWGSPVEHQRTDGLRRWRDRLTNHCLLDAFDMSPARMDEYLDNMQRFQPACLYGYPSSLTLLAEHARRCGRRLRLPNLRVIFVTGEVCFPHHRAALRDFFNVPVANGYGSREAGFIAHECPLGNMHITAENVVVEILGRSANASHAGSVMAGQAMWRRITTGEPDPDRVQATADSTGEIVITHLDAFGMPLIRYRTGDIGRLKPGRCACGRGLPMLDVVEGRTTDFLYLPSGVIKHALAIIYPLRSLPGVGQFRVTQDADYSIKVHVVPVKDDGLTPADIARRVHPVFGEEVDVDVECVDKLPAADSGKFRYVISHVRPSVPTLFSTEPAHA